MPSAGSLRQTGDQAVLERVGRVAAGGFLLATDVDGTLLTRDYRLLPQVRAAVQHARAHGIITMLATARGPAALEIVLAELGHVDFAICFGGALVLKREAEQWALALPERVTLDLGDTTRVWNAAQALDLTVGAYTENGVHINGPDDWFKRELEHTGEPVFATPFASIADPVFKLLAIRDPSRVDDLERLRQRLPGTLEGVYSHPNYLEITVKGVSKGKALESFCKSRSLDRSAVVAVGDSDNDVSMFQSAGHSAAMPDSSPAARSAANWVVSADSPAGLASVIDHYASSLWRIPASPDPRIGVKNDGR